MLSIHVLRVNQCYQWKRGRGAGAEGEDEGERRVPEANAKRGITV